MKKIASEIYQEDHVTLKNKIFVITHDEIDYDIYDGFVIIAKDEKRVREIASKDPADEGSVVWLTRAIVEEIGESDLEEPIILSSFRAG